MLQIMTLKKQGHYQIACTSLFKATHPKEGLQDGLRHPNQYFAESQAILHGTSDSTESSEYFLALVYLRVLVTHIFEVEGNLLYKKMYINYRNIFIRCMENLFWAFSGSFALNWPKYQSLCFVLHNCILCHDIWCDLVLPL